ncbi:tripartite motif-containing protein 16-like [Pholidichthys leucotaenia]
MAQKGVQLDAESFSCSICLDLLKDPVMIACGHNYCMNCINKYWDDDDDEETHSCPQCQQTFRPRPVLVKNTMLAELVEELKKTGLLAAPGVHCYAGAEDVACDFCTGRKLKAIKSCLVCQVSYCETHLQPHYDVAPLKKHKLVEPSKNLQENICSRHDEMMKILFHTDQQIICYLCSMDHLKGHDTVSAAAEVEQEISELKRRDTELEQLSRTEDDTQFLHSYPSLSAAVCESTHSPSIHVLPLRYFEDVTAAVKELRDKLQELLTDTWTNISLIVNVVDGLQPQPEPKTRADFLQYSQEITLDPNTVYREMLLSEENRKVTVASQPQSYPPHPERFTDNWQVLSKESLSGRCYWEVEWSGGTLDVAVTCKNISRGGQESLFGFDDKSWAFECEQNNFVFIHNGMHTAVLDPRSSRIGVFLDHCAGLLSFYSVSETMTLLHRVQTTFTQPLYAGLCVWDWVCGATAERTLYKGIVGDPLDLSLLQTADIYKDFDITEKPLAATVVNSDEKPLVETAFGLAQKGSVLSYQQPILPTKLAPTECVHVCTEEEHLLLQSVTVSLDMAHRIEVATRDHLTSMQWCDFVIRAQEDMLVQRINVNSKVTTIIREREDLFYFYVDIQKHLSLSKRCN